MARYRIEISRTAEQQLKKIRRGDQRRVVAAILGLADDPHPNGSRKLVGYDDVFRIRVGQYRVLYSVSGKKLIVIVLKIGNRKDVYR
jgi:mRNA interferase RelE/StbE